jgi:hypothetical protein
MEGEQHRPGEPEQGWVLARAAPGTAPTDKGACRAVWAGICDNSDDSCCGVMTDASHKYSSSCLRRQSGIGLVALRCLRTALMVRMERLSWAICISSSGAMIETCRAITCVRQREERFM